MLILGLVALGALCSYAAGKLNKGQLDAELSQAGIAPDFKADLYEIVSIPEVRAMLSKIKVA